LPVEFQNAEGTAAIQVIYSGIVKADDSIDSADSIQSGRFLMMVDRIWAHRLEGTPMKEVPESTRATQATEPALGLHMLVAEPSRPTPSMRMYHIPDMIKQ
jgi:hypothetical protein